MPTALVLGGAKPGIGQATVRLLLEKDYDVVATFEPEDQQDLAAFMQEVARVTWLGLDSRDQQSALATLESVLDVSGVVDAEFYFYMEGRDEFDHAQWTRSLFVNLTLPKAVGQACLTKWPSCHGVVFITSSEAATGSFGAHAYAATKAGVHNLAKSLANVAAGRCRFNCLAAGWIGGVMDTDEVFNMSRQITPLKRLGTPEEIAGAAVWLMECKDAAFVNGATLVADGGYTGVDTISKHEYESEHGAIT